jgi:hypothetical protein
LKELKFKTNENLGAYRKSSYMSKRIPILVDNLDTGKAELTDKALDVSKEIFEEFSVENISDIDDDKRIMKADNAI